MANREREDEVEPESLAGAGDDESPDRDLVRRAVAVLDANWLGAATSPSVRLYPHQWSWDSACIAMGYAPVDQSRAESEFRSLFAGQWKNGLLPHIVYTDGAHYFPGPEFWETDRSPDAPERPRTSGIVQPPVHATAAWRFYRRARDRKRAAAFLEELFPELVAWHGYLYRERARDGDGLVEIWHPWESGMDNSPLWDAALERIEPEQLAYERIDVRIADPDERPSDREYDRYVHLVGLFRGLGYRSDAIREVTPFALQPVLFNSLLVQANRDLAEIARLLGSDHRELEAWADQTESAIEGKLWEEEHGIYVDFDVTARAHVRVHTATGLSPLYAGVPEPARAARLINALSRWQVDVDGAWAIASFAPDEPGFQPTRYWRGPIWPIVNWVVARGLDRYGYTEQAAAVRAAIVGLSRRNGFWEHYSPVTGDGHGAGEFAWTAGLVLDLLHEDGR
jgi:glycogen debranching enzyme